MYYGGSLYEKIPKFSQVNLLLHLHNLIVYVYQNITTFTYYSIIHIGICIPNLRNKKLHVG